MKYQTDNTRIAGWQEVTSPRHLIERLPIKGSLSALVFNARRELEAVLNQQDDRLIVVVGPCSIHDPASALEYAERLAKEIPRLSSELLIVMRVYFEKPRTTVGWKGLINDPHLDESFDINEGFERARQLLLKIGELGVPAGTEYLDPISPQYIGDLISWAAIGARTTESQVHRELASGLSCPVGFKNGTNGSVQVAVDAIKAAAHSHVFLSITKEGHSAIFNSTGNPVCHIILRGGTTPNYAPEHIERVTGLLAEAHLGESVMVDFSHGNSLKQPERQVEVCRSIAEQIAAGNRRIVGAMIESHLNPGSQKLQPGTELKYGVSITDGCIGWKESLQCLDQLAAAVAERRGN